MTTPILFKIRVTDDEEHAISVNDFDSFENTILFLCMENLNEELDFSIMFVEDEELSRVGEKYDLRYDFGDIDDDD